MERTLALEAIDHTPPAAAVKRDGSPLYDLTLNLRDVFHHGYIDVHTRPPREGTNPMLEEYEPLLVPDSDKLVWQDGIGDDDHKKSESHRLGRMFARAYLSLLGYSWFATVSALRSSPENGWTVRRPGKGDMPDWLVGNAVGGDNSKFAVAEAKGTHAAISKDSSVLDKSWRPQVKNVEVLKDDMPVKLKGWIVATRWVSAKQTNTEPKMYAEDPDTPGERTLGPDDQPSLALWIARAHVLQNLLRLGQRRLAQRVAALGDHRSSLPRASVTTWSCAAPGLGSLRFVGRPIGGFPPIMSGWRSVDWRLLRDFHLLPIDRETWETWTRMSSAASDDALENTWFDGVALPAVSAIIASRVPPSLREMEVTGAARPDVSILSDGSLLAPMSLMKPLERVEL